MAGSSQQGVHVVKLRPIVVPESLQIGSKFVKWDEVRCMIKTLAV